MQSLTPKVFNGRMRMIILSIRMEKVCKSFLDKDDNFVLKNPEDIKYFLKLSKRRKSQGCSIKC